MRTGLVAVGTAFSVVGAAVIVGVLTPLNGPTVARSSSADLDDLNGGNWRPLVLPASPTQPATLSLDWYATPDQPGSTGLVDVSLFAAYPCPPATEPCVDDPALAAWNGTGAGHWSSTGRSGSMYLLYVDALGPSNDSVSFSATLVEQYPSGTHLLPMLPFAVTMVGGGLLMGVGAVALYLGLFLPAGVYAPPDAAPVPDDDATGPEGGPTDDGGPGATGPHPPR